MVRATDCSNSTAMLRTVLAVLLAAVALSAELLLSHGGLSLLTDFKPLIFDGQDAHIEEFPYVLSMKVGPKFRQGAILVSPQWALTLATSFDAEDTPSITLRAGSAFRDGGGQLRFVKRAFVHPQFLNGSYDYNFVLMETDSPFELNKDVQPIPLPKQGYEVPPFTRANVSGWGNLHANDKEFSMNLKFAQVNILSDDVCRLLNKDWVHLTRRMLCANLVGTGKNPCAGDRGGPLVADGMLIGVVVSDICDKELTYSNIYSKVSDQRSWIDSVIGTHGKH